MMRERDFPRRGIDVAAKQTGVTGGMMWRAKWAASDERLARSEQAHDAVNLRGLERLLQRQRRKDGREPLGEHRFAGAGRANEQDVVTACSGNFEGTLDRFLSFDFREIKFVVLTLVEQ